MNNCKSVEQKWTLRLFFLRLTMVGRKKNGFLTMVRHGETQSPESYCLKIKIFTFKPVLLGLTMV